MSETIITNSQYVRIRCRTASLGDRFVAWMADSCIGVLYTIGCIKAMQYISGWKSLSDWIIILMLLPVLLYPLIWETLNQGRSPGKMLLRLRVVRTDGSTPSFESYFMRWLLLTVDILPGGSIGILSVILTDRNQRLGDLAAGTLVIKEPKLPKIQVCLDEFNYLKANYRPTFPVAAELSPDQVRLITQTLESRSRHRDRQIELLSRKIQKLFALTSMSDTTDEDFLRTLVQDYQFYNLQETEV